MSTRVSGGIRLKCFSTPATTISPVVRVARTHDDVLNAWRLLYDVYCDSGFIGPNPFEVHTVPQAVEPQSIVFLAAHGKQKPIGTVSAIRDSATGLPLDAVCDHELDALRATGHRLIEIGLFCTDRERAPRTIVAELIRYASHFGLYTGATYFVCGVHPHHVRFYQRGIGFQPLTDVRKYRTVNDNPVVMMGAETHVLLGAAEEHRVLNGALAEPIPTEVFERRYRFDSRTLPASPIGQYLAAKAIPFEFTSTAIAAQG